MVYFGDRIDTGHTKILLKIFGRGDFKFCNTVVGIDTVLRFFRLLLQGFHHLRESHFVRFAHSHVDELHIGMSGHRRFFCTFDFFKFIDRCIFSKSCPADSVGKKGLDITFVCRDVHTIATSGTILINYCFEVRFYDRALPWSTSVSPYYE